MGVLPARRFFLSLSLLTLPIAATIAVQTARAETQRPAAVQAQRQQAASYEDKKRQANDIAVSVGVSGLSCTCEYNFDSLRDRRGAGRWR